MKMHVKITVSVMGSTSVLSVKKEVAAGSSVNAVVQTLIYVVLYSSPHFISRGSRFLLIDNASLLTLLQREEAEM